jgi:Mg-chelatase subunit ChlD
LFDPTQIKKDKKNPKDEEDGEADPYQQNSIDNIPDIDDPNADDGVPSDEPSEDEGKSGDSSDKEKEEKDKDKDGKGKGESDEDADAKTSDVDEEEDGMSLEELADQLELGSLEIDPKTERQPLKQRALVVLMQSVLAMNQKGRDIQNRLQMIKPIIRSSPNQVLKDIFQKALTVHGKDHPELKSWIESVTYSLSKQSINKSYQDIYQIISALKLYAKVLDTDEDAKIKPPLALIKKLEEVLSELKKLAHADSVDIGLVRNLVKDLPGITSQVLKQKFDLTTVGPNTPTRNTADALKKGQLNDLKLMAALGPHTDFILNSTPRPEYRPIKTWLIDRQRPRGNDILPMMTMSDPGRVILGDPAKSLKENFDEGTAYVLTRRKTIDIPHNSGKDEAERITIVLYDTSGSMNGNPGDFQAGLISAFTAKALADVSHSGRHRHKVILLPFDGNPGEPRVINNAAAALEVIANYRSQLANTNGSTDIQKALIQAMALIADAEKRTGEPLAAANIILMTDGMANINPEELYRARRAIDRTTPLQTMFIAINETKNEALRKFAEDSAAIGAEKGFYREFDSDTIDRYINESKVLKRNSDEEFYSEASPRDIPTQVQIMLDDAMKLAINFTQEMYYGMQHTSPADHLAEFERKKWPAIKDVDRPLKDWIIRARQFLRSVYFSRNPKVHDYIIDDLVRNMEELTGVSYEQVSQDELELIRHLIKKTVDD